MPLPQSLINGKGDGDGAEQAGTIRSDPPNEAKLRTLPADGT
jgi:hypothetical protein